MQAEIEFPAVSVVTFARGGGAALPGTKVRAGLGGGGIAQKPCKPF